jgi:signal transduction histidine kinase
MPPPESLEDLLAYFDYGDVDRALLAELAPVLEKSADSLVSAFYRQLLSHPTTRRLLRDPEVKDRLLQLQRQYLLSLAGPAIDESYLQHRRRIGEIHERIGLEPRWYLGAYALYLSLLTPLVCERFAKEPHRGERAVVALQKLLLFDASLAMETYIGRREQELEYLNRELSRSGRELAHDLETQSEQLRRTAERAQAAEQLASIGTLVAGLSDEQARWRLQTIQEQIARISKIIQSLLNMARPTRSARMPVALEPLLDGTLAFLGEKFRRRDIRVERCFEPAASIRGDAERLQQLFLNLFLNAADAMPGGGELGVSLRPRGSEVEVTVSDTGAGIDPDDLARIFDPFFTTKPAGEGNGLGLSVARSIVTDHGGRIEACSRPGGGTQFRIVLPGLPHRGEMHRPGA